MSFAKPPTYRIKRGKGQGFAPQPPEPGPFNYSWGGKRTPNTGMARSPAQWTLPGRAAPPSSALPPPAAAGAPPTNAPTQDAPITPTPPPETVQGALDRGGAEDQYSLGIPDVNHQLWEAAFNYGGAPQAQQFGYALNPATGKYEDSSSTVDVGSNPNSKLAVIARQLGLDTTNLSNNLNDTNSFFSGAHVEDQGRLNDQAGRDRLQAHQDYEDAVNGLVTAINQARHDRDVSLGGADITDLNAAAAVDPQAQDDTAPPDATAAPAGTPPATPNKPATRYPHGSSNKTLTIRRGRGGARGTILGPSKNVGLLPRKRKK